ncbi:hypothetical protein [Neobacillus sp. DY30]|uniref:hypothetical protein n=1 Tax=Neobacillus sp. DY30 TaxID=3047871 RepID=UPI0024BFEA98|nr:hypothetical protein [Neobacillus sp. DY30]WHX99492.1 hypothetical protein QNH29_23340 [Neobacillus sp. DY30]
MQSIIWAFGSMVVLLGIISFLPIGLTIKGKVIVGIAGFVLSIGGLAATSTIPLWSTFLLLLVITFFTAYLIDSRMRKVIYYERISPEEESYQNFEEPFSNGKKDRKEEVIFQNELTELKTLNEIEENSDSIEREDPKGRAPIVSESLLQDDFKLEEIDFTNNEDILDVHARGDNIEGNLELSSISETDKEDLLEELSDYNLLGVNENFERPYFNDSETGEGYLSEIESLLDEPQREEFYGQVSEPQTIEYEENVSISEESWLDELWESEVMANDEKNEGVMLENKPKLEDLELEIMFAAKEVAASVEERGPEKKLAELQK